jgi:hypothetical protein
VGDGGEEEHDRKRVSDGVVPAEEDGNADTAKEAKDDPGYEKHDENCHGNLLEWPQIGLGFSLTAEERGQNNAAEEIRTAGGCGWR